MINNYDASTEEYSNAKTTQTTSNLFEQTSLRYVSNGGDLTQGSLNAAGLDLQAYSIDDNWIGTGIYAAIPNGWVGLLVPRSSLGLKGFRLKNTLGVIDSDYRGEIKLAYEGYKPDVGERVAQLVLVPHYGGAIERMVSIADLDTTDRGEGGFGSTGV